MREMGKEHPISVKLHKFNSSLGALGTVTFNLAECSLFKVRTFMSDNHSSFDYVYNVEESHFRAA